MILSSERFFRAVEFGVPHVRMFQLLPAACARGKALAEVSLDARSIILGLCPTDCRGLFATLHCKLPLLAGTQRGQEKIAREQAERVLFLAEAHERDQPKILTMCISWNS